MSPCGWVCAKVFVHVYFSGKLSYSLANWITLLQAKSLATEIKQLCFVVMVHKILFKIRLPSRKRHKRDKRKQKKSTQSTVSETCCLHWSQLIRSSSRKTWHAHFKHQYTAKSFNRCCEGWTLEWGCISSAFLWDNWQKEKKNATNKKVPRLLLSIEKRGSDCEMQEKIPVTYLLVRVDQNSR